MHNARMTSENFAPGGPRKLLRRKQTPDAISETLTVFLDVYIHVYT